jgi:hypothetical protein
MSNPDAIRYKRIRSFVAVYIGSRRVGAIIGNEAEGFTYAPKHSGSRPLYGPTFKTLSECQRSLEQPFEG